MTFRNHMHFSSLKLFVKKRYVISICHFFLGMVDNNHFQKVSEWNTQAATLYFFDWQDKMVQKSYQIHYSENKSNCTDGFTVL